MTSLDNTQNIAHNHHKPLELNGDHKDAALSTQSKKRKRSEDAELTQAQPKSNKKSRKLRPNKDTADVAKGPHEKSAHNKSSHHSLDVWMPEALSMFMFENAPILLQLSFAMRKTLSEAQVTEAKSQIAATEVQANATIAKGIAQAEQTKQGGIASIAGGLGSLLQSGLMLKDTLLDNEDHTKALNKLDGMVDSLDSAEASKSNTFGSTFDEAAVIEKAQEFKGKYKTALDEGMAKLKKEEERSSLRDKAQTSPAGLGRKIEDVKITKRANAQKDASATAFDEFFADKVSKNTFFEEMRDNPQTAKTFMEALTKGETNPTKAAKNLSDMISGMDPSELDNTLRSFGGTEEGQAFNRELTSRRDTLAGKATMEQRKMQTRIETRQLLAQILSGLTKGSTDLVSQTQVIIASQQDAEAQRAATNASIMQSVRGAQDGSISNALSDVKQLFEWFSSLNGQIASATAQSMA